MGDGADSPAPDAGRDDDEHTRRRKIRSKRKRKSRKQERLLRNLAWLGGGLAIGLPILAAMLFAMSRY